MGSIEQLPSQRWRGIARNPQTGQRRSKTFDTAHEADAWWKATERDWDGVYEQAGIAVTRQVRGIKRWTLGEWAEHYLAEAEVTEATRTNYAYLLGLAQRYFGEDRMLAEITRSEVTGWMAEMRRAGRSNHNRCSALVVTKMMFRAAVEVDVLTVDPSYRVPLPKLDPVVERVLTEVEFSAVLAKLPATLRPMALLGYDSGLRWGEAAALSVQRLNLLHRRVTVVDHLRRDGTVQHHTKGRNRRDVPLTARTVEAIEAHMRTYRRWTGCCSPATGTDRGRAAAPSRHGPPPAGPRSWRHPGPAGMTCGTASAPA